MAHSYPIWHDVSACHYKSSKSWGGKNNSIDNIYVGSSPKYSSLFVKTKTTRRQFDGNTEFRYFVDGKLVKRMLFKGTERLHELIEEWSLFDEEQN